MHTGLVRTGTSALSGLGSRGAVNRVIRARVQPFDRTRPAQVEMTELRFITPSRPADTIPPQGESFTLSSPDPNAIGYLGTTCLRRQPRSAHQLERPRAPADHGVRHEMRRINPVFPPGVRAGQDHTSHVWRRPTATRSQQWDCHERAVGRRIQPSTGRGLPRVSGVLKDPSTRFLKVWFIGVRTEGPHIRHPATLPLCQ
jgi:hypothetical protein